MQQEFFGLLQKAISENRLSSYLSAQDNSELEGYARYLWNIALSESLYPALNGLEVTLRNGVHSAGSSQFGGENWFEQVLQPSEQANLQKIRDRLSKQQKPSSDIHQLIASSSFGFWVSLFSGRYEKVLWHKRSFLRDVFPYMDNKLRTRALLSKRLNQVRKLRNRVFHYEPVWHWKNLEQHHADILEAIAWMSPSMRVIVRLQDRFPGVYRLGSSVYEESLLGTKTQ